MGTDGSLLVLVFALCAAGAQVGMVVAERHNPLLLGWVGSLAALAALWVSGHTPLGMTRSWSPELPGSVTS